jgi:hypothetical protein
MRRKISQRTFWLAEFYIKTYKFQCDFDDNLSVTHVFIKQIFKAVEQAPSSPAPPELGVG